MRYDPGLSGLFDGEEFTRSIRAFTHGSGRALARGTTGLQALREFLECAVVFQGVAVVFRVISGHLLFGKVIGGDG